MQDEGEGEQQQWIPGLRRIEGEYAFRVSELG